MPSGAPIGRSSGRSIFSGMSTPSDIASLRIDYARHSLDESDVGTDPIAFARHWLDEAIRAELPEPTAMTLATASPDGAPNARVVLLKAIDQGGFTFFTDYRSRKGLELELNPRAALVFVWLELERQVRITGTVAKVTREESDAYYHSRPEKSRMGAWASHQSTVIANRAVLERQFAEVQQRHADGNIPAPAHWGGYRVTPETVEFWQGRRSRLHDRIRFVRAAEGWTIERLSP